MLVAHTIAMEAAAETWKVWKKKKGSALLREPFKIVVLVIFGTITVALITNNQITKAKNGTLSQS
ncbi:hypothetical protein ACFQ1M_06810 [Sungkyunkwania multivorans]|uniref:Uncharacterized protein n=1 Tax=Sungkyunkwania multivorans TaxID=1173618 RepID=A0ABW3CVU2_9FLAO